MITIHINRYYGNTAITKSIVMIENARGKIIFAGEAREVAFKDYCKGEKIKNGASYCLGRGEYRLTETSTRGMRLCWKLADDVKHRGFLVCCMDEVRQNIEGMLNVGYGEDGVEAPFRRLERMAEAKEKLIGIIERHFKEEVRMVVRNVDVEVEFADTGMDFFKVEEDVDDEDEEDEIW